MSKSAMKYLEMCAEDSYKGLRELKADLEEHKKECKARPGNCPYERKVEKEINRRSENDLSDKIDSGEGKVKLEYVYTDSLGRPAYKDRQGKMYKDLNCGKYKPALYELDRSGNPKEVADIDYELPSMRKAESD